MRVYNSTEYTEEEIKKQKIIGLMKNHWRQRDVTIYESPDERMVFTIGLSFDKSTKTITHEGKEGFSNSISMYPKTYEYH